jgi:enoyl-CoA hydratase
MLVTGDRSARGARGQLGLIGRVVPDGQALAEARKIADASPPTAARGPRHLATIRETAMLPERDAFGR